MPPKKRDNLALIVVLVVLVLVVPIVIGAILYVMVSGLITPTGPGGPGPTPRVIGVSVSRSADGTNWTLLITSVSGGFTTTGTFLTVRNAGGSIVLSAKAFNILTWTMDRAIYQSDGDSLVETAESLLLSATQYPTGHRVEITEGSQVLFSGILA